MKNRRILLITAVLVTAGLLTMVYQSRKADEQLMLDASIALEAGISQFRNEQYDSALQTLKDIPEAAITDWRIPYYAGSSLIKLKDYEAAVPKLEEALDLNAREVNVLFALGVVYYKLGNIALSKGYFTAVLEVDPGHEEARGLMDIMAGLERYSRTDSSKKEN